MKLTRTFFNDIRALIRAARATVARGVDLVQVHTNFEIGRRIVEREQQGKERAAYGKEVIKALAERLTREFGKGFSERNLASMRTFFLQYQERSPILQSLIAKLPGTKKSQSPVAKSSLDQISQSLTDQFPIAPPLTGQSASSAQTLPRPFTLSWTHYLFLLGIKNPEERSFYEIEATSQSWTLSELKRQFDSSLYERLALSRDKKGVRKLATEGQIIARPEDVLKLTHQDLGQMQMYVNYFDREEKLPDEAPTIGIILCKQKNKAMVRITLPRDANIHAREYRLYLPSKEELQRKLVEWTAERETGDE
jgi:hypothetical protein